MPLQIVARTCWLCLNDTDVFSIYKTKTRSDSRHTTMIEHGADVNNTFRIITISTICSEADCVKNENEPLPNRCVRIKSAAEHYESNE